MKKLTNVFLLSLVLSLGTVSSSQAMWFGGQEQAREQARFAFMRGYQEGLRNRQHNPANNAMPRGDVRLNVLNQALCSSLFKLVVAGGIACCSLYLANDFKAAAMDSESFTVRQRLAGGCIASFFYLGFAAASASAIGWASVAFDDSTKILAHGYKKIGNFIAWLDPRRPAANEGENPPRADFADID
jgi:hypothetical protein